MVRRRGFSLVEILVVLAIIGILLGMLCPAVQRARELGHRSACQDKLKKMGVAMHNYHDTYNVLPPSTINPGGWLMAQPNIWSGNPKSFWDGQPYKVLNHTGFTLLLPYLGQELLYKRFDLSKPACNVANRMAMGDPNVFMGYNVLMGAAPGVYADIWLLPNYPAGVKGSANDDVVGERVETYECSAEGVPEVHTVDAVYTPANQYNKIKARASNFLFVSLVQEDCPYPCMDWDPAGGAFMVRVGGDSPFGANSKVRLEEITDGLGTTLAIGESRQEHVPYFRYACWDEDLVNVGSWQNFHPGPHWATGSQGSAVGNLTSLSFMINYPRGKAYYPASDPRSKLPGERTFSSVHPGGANFLFCDGAVRFLKNKTSLPLLMALRSMAGGESVPDDSLPE